ncbi:MAG TPA: polyketide synthase dehydratase domain-containing protein, partial [Burkholderiaceae bacterium]|nr:polyketide synthase dehydratase domain-containing protein [Burkholderiaceae bacterium]
MRFSAADREALRALMPPGAQPAAAAAAGVTAVSDPVAQAPELPAASDAVSPPEADAPAAAALPADGRGQLVAEYFDLMRGFLDQQRSVLQRWQGDEQAAPATRAYPLLDAITEADEQHLLADCRVDVATQAYLRDHVLSGPVTAFESELRGLACVPMMVSLEIMAEACACLMSDETGDAAPQVIEQVKAFDWIALDEGEAALQVRADRIDALSCRALLTRDGKPIISAVFGFDAQWQLPPVAPPAAPQPTPWNGDELYQIGMFHGPIFQSIRHIDGWDAGGITAQLTEVGLDGFLTPGERPALVLNPVLLDAVGQLAAFWIAQYAGYDFNCFPSTIERIELYQPCPAGLAGLQLHARQAPLDPAATEVAAVRRWDFECVDAHGQPLLRIKNLVNVFFAVPNRFYQVRRSPLDGALGAPAGLPAPDGVLLWDLPHLPDEFCAQSGSIFLRMLAHAVLGGPERAEWAALTGSLTHRRQWLLGRACLKEAVREWVQQQSGQRLH